MTAIAIAWLIIGAVTFVALLAEYIEDRRSEGLPALAAGDAWGIPAGLLIILLAWPLALLMDWYRNMVLVTRAGEQFK